ncbi:hypothetical protein C8R43DRAFT_504835 [Mycena crocata]|nr:hypothetical protein C8R43DRAFT_504835 [Mycena crocata]
MAHGHDTPNSPGTTPILPPPIHRLPAELIAEIFQLCWLSFTPIGEERFLEEAGARAAIQHLAHLPLLEVSRVCSQWHTIVMGTPSLWGDIQLDGKLWDFDTTRPKVIGLLESALARGGTSPLQLAINDWSTTLDPEGPELALLATHSERFQTAVFDYCSADILRSFSTIKGRLPVLESLAIHMWDDVPATLDIFEVLPSLKSLTFEGSIPGISKLPLGQISCLAYIYVAWVNVPWVISLLSRSTRMATFRLGLSATSMDYTPLHVTPLVSNLTHFHVQLSYAVGHFHSKDRLGDIFDALELPLLRKLTLESPWIWPHPQFLSICSRSAFHSHFQSLKIYDVHISSAELLECLCALPALEYLAISDPYVNSIEGVEEQPVITDALFTALTVDPNSPCLVPHLHFLCCRSRMEFDDSIYLAFVLSRLHGRSPSLPSLTNEIWCEDGYHRDLDTNVFARLKEVHVDGGFSFGSWKDAD